MKDSIEILKAGAYSTVQDMGRFGFKKFGVPVSGAMDLKAAQLANALVNNTGIEALMEITLSGPTLLFNADCLVAITGADISPRLNKSKIPHYSPFLARKGDKLHFGKLKSGCRAYVAVNGGFQTPEVMNSRSWFNHITKQATLSKGDILPVKSYKDNFEPVHASLVPPDFNRQQLEVWPGPEFDYLPANVREQLFSREFSISGQASRMGYRIEEKLQLSQPLAELLTSAVIPGTVQLTPSGEMIILMRDCQTTGGYPRILQLKEESINVLAQKKTGEKITLVLQEV